MDYSIQLWSLRETAREIGWPRAVETASELGFTTMEPFALHLLRDELVPTLRDRRILTPTAHGFLDADALDATLDVAVELEVGTVFHPHFDESHWASAASVRATAELLVAASERAAARGIRVGFHNHDYELQRLIDGRTAFLTLLDLLPPQIVVEYDIYWAAIAGADVVADLRRLQGRIAALHIKDGPLGGTAEQQVALGDGELPLALILDAAPDALAVLSLDRMPGSADDVRRAVERSHRWLTVGAER